MHADDSNMMTPQRWLNLWSTTMQQGLKGCRGAPTIIIDSRTIIGDVRGSLRNLLASLEHVGVRGLSMPDDDEIHTEIEAYIRTGPREYHVSQAAQEKYGLLAQPEVDTTPPVMSPEQVRSRELCALPGCAPVCARRGSQRAPTE